MNETFLFSVVMVCAVFVASLTQILLKKSADAEHKNRLFEYLNKKVVGAYVIFGSVAMVNMYVLRFIPLSLAVVLESFAYVFVPVLSIVFLKERMKVRQLVGVLVIVIGIYIFSLGEK